MRVGTLIHECPEITELKLLNPPLIYTRGYTWILNTAGVDFLIFFCPYCGVKLE